MTRPSWTTRPGITSGTRSGGGRPASAAPGRALAGLEPRGRRARRRHVERAHVWVDGEPAEVGPLAFADDLSRVGDLHFTPWCAREDHTRRPFFSSDYLQPFGSFEGELPGGLRAGLRPRRYGVARRSVVAGWTDDRGDRLDAAGERC